MDAWFVTALSGVLVAGILGLTLYLGAPGQQLRPTPLVPRLTSALAIALGSGAIVLLRRVLGPAEAVYATILIVTIVTTVLPFLAAALQKRTVTSRTPLSGRHWFGKAMAGLILGFGLALAVSGLFAWFGPGGLFAGTGKTQLNMWLMSPVWVCVLAFCFMFPNSRSAWCWLGLTNLAAFGLLLGGRWLLLLSIDLAILIDGAVFSLLEGRWPPN
jgi:hypothetical protein